MAFSGFAIPAFKVIPYTSTLAVSDLKQPRIEDRNIRSGVEMQLH